MLHQVPGSPMLQFFGPEARLNVNTPLIRSLRLLPVVLIALGAGHAAQAAEGEAAAISAAVSVAVPASDSSDPQFRSLFNSWRIADGDAGEQASIPSQKPVDSITLSSSYGMRSDPFTGRARRHAGIDIPGPLGTPIYATADGVAEHAGWMNGYGNLVKLEHGRGLETRYGHMSRLAVSPGDRVTKGQLIGYMGSTGRSTGSHLHYEVRIDGSPVNPMPFLASSDYMIALKDAPRGQQVALGGPDESGDD